MTKFVATMLGDKFVNSQPYDLERSFAVRALMCYFPTRLLMRCSPEIMCNCIIAFD